MRGAGKTTLGARLAKSLARAFFDVDQEIEKELVRLASLGVGLRRFASYFLACIVWCRLESFSVIWRRFASIVAKEAEYPSLKCLLPFRPNHNRTHVH
jgi:deoxyadenosine/deoxycytidine kinase